MTSIRRTAPPVNLRPVNINILRRVGRIVLPVRVDNLRPIIGPVRRVVVTQSIDDHPGRLLHAGVRPTHVAAVAITDHDDGLSRRGMQRVREGGALALCEPLAQVLGQRFPSVDADEHC